MKQLKTSWDVQKTELTTLVYSLWAEKEAVLMLNEAIKDGASSGTAAVDRYKLGLKKEMKRLAGMQLEKNRLDDELSTLKFSLQRAEKNQMLARQELALTKLQLRR
ncbi:hypothetical protein R1sor_027059 [Riccia sorocarpa]|uniref:Uncharacterized protein n=1 Tax=Riccia sorocarpa TaxID=122646 RepID=A0ABD3GGU2_9MARC